MAPRLDLVSSAVNFLRDPSVASSPVEKRIEFLQSKNLTQEEIDLALAQASGDSNVASENTPYYSSQQYQRPPPPGFNYGNNAYANWPQPPPDPPRRDWRDWFIMATVVGGASYGLFVLAQRYIKPLIAPPTPPQLEQDKAAIDEQFNRAFALLDTLSEDTTKLKEAEEARTQRLDSAISDIENIITDLKAANTRREDDSRRMEAEIKTMKDSLPRAIESVKEGSERQLKELSSELSGLKTLLSNRMGGSAGYGPASVPRVPKAEPPPFSRSSTNPQGSDIAPGSQNKATGVNGSATVPSFANPSTSSNPSINTAASSSSIKPNTNLGYGSGKVSIPAWQLAAQNKKDSSSSTMQANGVNTDGADAVAALNAS